MTKFVIFGTSAPSFSTLIQILCFFLILLHTVDHPFNELARLFTGPKRAVRKFKLCDRGIIDLDRITWFEGSTIVTVLDSGGESEIF